MHTDDNSIGTSRRQGVHINTKAISDSYLKCMEIIVLLAAMRWAANASSSWALDLMVGLGWLVLLGHLLWVGLKLSLWAISHMKNTVTIPISWSGAVGFMMVSGLIGYFVVISLTDALDALAKTG